MDIQATLTERGSRYGNFAGHALVTQRLKEVCSNTDNWEQKLNPIHKEAIEMICHKLGRILNGDPNYADSWVDIAGYAQLVVNYLEGMKRPQRAACNHTIFSGLLTDLQDGYKCEKCGKTYIQAKLDGEIPT